MHCFRRVTVICAALLWSLLYVSIVNAEIVYDTLGRPTQISKVEIADEFYDVSVDYSKAFTNIFKSPTSPSPRPLFWNDIGGASAAASALAGALNLDGSAFDLGVATPVNIWTPKGYSSFPNKVTVSAAYGNNANPDPPIWNVHSNQYIPEDSLSVSGGWAQYTAVSGDVPEPSTLVLFSILSAMGLLVGWRRRKRRV